MQNPDYDFFLSFSIKVHSLPEFLGKKVEEEDDASLNDSSSIYNLSSA